MIVHFIIEIILNKSQNVHYFKYKLIIYVYYDNLLIYTKEIMLLKLVAKSRIHYKEFLEVSRFLWHEIQIDCESILILQTIECHQNYAINEISLSDAVITKYLQFILRK